MNWQHIYGFVFFSLLLLQTGCEDGDSAPTEDADLGGDRAPEQDSELPSDKSSGNEDSTDDRSSCPDEPLPAGRYTLNLQHDNNSREYVLYVPQKVASDQPNPLVFNFHGYTSNMNQQELFSGMNPTAEKEGFILVYPNGLVNEIDGATAWNAGGCCAYGEELTRDDVGFVRTLIEDLKKKVCIDDQRIYATGMSNGGFMSHYLACEASDTFAAIASVAGVMALSPAYCTPSRAVPILHFHGTQDSIVPYGNEGEEVYLTSVPETFAGWAEINKCQDVARETYRKGDASCATHSQCQDGVEVTLCTIEGMDHCWPGQPFCFYSGSTTDISANKEIWKFFSRFRLKK